jgi:hypothetical protein
VTFGLNKAGADETYVWLRSGVPIQGANGPSITLTSDVSTVTRTYTVQATNRAGTTVSSGTLTFREATLAEWLAAHSLNGLQANDDSDGDGANNFSEYLARTDPTNGASVFSTGLEFQVGSVRLRWKTYPGRQYFIEKSADLSNWVPTGVAIEGDGGEKVMDVPYNTDDPALYWRVRLAKP